METQSHGGTRECGLSQGAHQANYQTEAAVLHSLGNLGCCVKEAAAATHSLTCVVSDRESNEIRYLQQAIELIEEWQNQLQGV